MIGSLKLALSRRIDVARLKASRLNPSSKALLWMAASGFLYCLLNATLRSMSLYMSPYQALTLVYGSTLLVMLPLVLRTGVAHFRPRNLSGLVVRGGVHWLGMCLWLVAVTHITLAETTAIGFTTPLFIMIGATFLLKEAFRWERGVAILVGFGGVLIVVGPRLTGSSSVFPFVMLSASAVFASSFILSKRLTRVEEPWVIVVWQSLIVTLFSIPLAVTHWLTPTPAVLLTALLSGVLTFVGNYCLTRAFTVGDLSASQPAKFLDLVWASVLGWLIFGDRVEQSTMIGGLMILLSTIWVARRESAR
jgi:drug/metabolite transporter (DMT)-like permease